MTKWRELEKIVNNSENSEINDDSSNSDGGMSSENIRKYVKIKDR